MGIAIKLKGKAGTFRSEDFTPTKWATAEEKAKISNKLTRFILGGFQQAAFTKAMYQRLSNMFGHIAHYDINGFYSTWFTDIKSCRDWVEHITGSWLSGIGDPKFTWSDAEKALIQWVLDNQIAEQLDELCRLDIEQKERTMLNALKQKYPSLGISVHGEEVIPVPVQIPVARTDNHQLLLFQEVAD
ncbi:MAG: hypothetical protein DCC56_01440 [Anaerolineae bacterium]|nr:MAG: hypothetical protein DCC56_01440 [Anaerolineae bacterium]WKZ44699.1 MAG: hypothetical protein QY302_02770 [Anaerolineales bacterium]